MRYQTRALLLLQESPAWHEAGAAPQDQWPELTAHPTKQHCQCEGPVFGQVSESMESSAGKTSQQKHLLDAPCFPNNNFPQQKCWFKLFMLTWVQDKVMWFLEPPGQVVNDAVMKRKFHAHCPANKDRIVKPAVLSSAWCGHTFAEESLTEDGDFWTSSPSHFSKIS